MLWVIALAGCSRSGEVGTGAVRVEVFYATFRPGCLTVTVQDEADATRAETQQLQVDARLSDDKRVAVFSKEGWSGSLRVTASARERSCSGPEVASSTQVIELPESGAVVAYLDLRAEDLDGDGYVSALAPQRGTDCDDNDASVNPGATETCDGVDNNCSGNELDAQELFHFYVDADEDGYGDSAQVRTGCSPPQGTVAAGGDCHDGNPAVHPGQAEQRCDGLDDNCDGNADEDFQVGSTCETELGCVGARACMANGSGAECVSAEVPTEWYVDADGDGRAGTSVGLSCVTPPEAVATKDDCDDDGSRFTGGAEVCDQLDNDCDGEVDEGCGAIPWAARSPGGNSAWEDVAVWGLGKTWLVGTGGAVTNVDGATVTNVTGCNGDWMSAWARPSDGRVFLGSAQGVLTTTTVAGGECTPVAVNGVTSSINGLVGFERNGVTTVYAVTSAGHVLRWEWQEASSSMPEVVSQVAANLRDVHGLSEDTLLAVGAEDYQGAGSAAPRAFRFDTASGQWARESLPVEVGTGAYLRGVHVVDGRLAYAVGDGGLLFERGEGTWRMLTRPVGSEDLRDVVAFGPTTVFVAAMNGSGHLLRFDGTTWTEPYNQGPVLRAVDGVDPQELWAAGYDGTLVRWGL